MNGKIVLVSNDRNFFEHMKPILSLRKSDKLFEYSFSDIETVINSIGNSIVMIDSENNKEQALQLISILSDLPTLIYSHNEDEELRIMAYNFGAFGYFSFSTSREEINALIKSALKLSNKLSKNELYRGLLVEKNVINSNNDVFVDYVNILDKEINCIRKDGSNATLIAISPDDNSKFLIKPNKIETIILNCVRDGDILMNFAPSKYFLLLKNTDEKQAEKIWTNIKNKISQNIFAGFAGVYNKTRQQVVNEALNKLHLAINQSKTNKKEDKLYDFKNFKKFKQEFKQKMEQIISPVFYQIQQYYCDKLFGIQIEQSFANDNASMRIKSKHAIGTLLITNPGFTTINIDITYKHIDTKDNSAESKRITLTPDEFESGFLHDLLEQFILSFKEFNNVNGDMIYGNN